MATNSEEFDACINIGYYAGSRSVQLLKKCYLKNITVVNDVLYNKINQGKNEFSIIYSAAFDLRGDAAVQSVVDPCNIGLYLHSKNPYLHSISRTSCNNRSYCVLCINSSDERKRGANPKVRKC